ncbi:hypothetical protein IMG5_197960 [Ichthyophthirius multifiliis]|uniref:Cyclic nucleotide-binding domain-containing protein n=1 Tax=Ichthyophthirius multifiliis TaxID=5932 RepID=G0R5D9_ICHMU|nr:hypothetical protein IMG5_197960 [Ichthyophthirius multifiliis]EGR27328.1 hypothetical protein IMG5_197960 [Ichthyophthirius multifiliis]|eukprot:XP_004024212.1 hypothetical protein IMG5_197960 [Ichthyophthirius multifiliis]
MDEQQQYIQQQLVNILKKPTEKRTQKDLHILINETKNIGFFYQYIQSGDNDIHYKCCKNMKYQYLNQDQIVFQIDSIGSTFYIILQGTVGVHIRLPNQTDLRRVKALETGSSFGELALLNNKPRLATIICESECHFATLEKKQFLQILKEKEEERINNEMGIFAKMPFLKTWNANLIRNLYLNSQKQQYIKGDKLFKEGNEPQEVFIILQGDFAVLQIR